MVHIPGQMLRLGFDVVHAIPASCDWAADWLHGAVVAQHSRPGRAPCGEVARLTCVGPMAPGYGLPPLSL